MSELRFSIKYSTDSLTPFDTEYMISFSFFEKFSKLNI